MSAVNSPYTRFVIISSHRSGSNYLSSLLSSHPQIMSIGEIYNPSVLFADPGLPGLHRNRVAKLLRDLAPVWFVKHGIYHAYPTHIRAVGFRYFYLHAQGRFHSVLDYLIAEKTIKIVHLKRRNLLRSYCSLLAAEQTGVWTVPVSSARTQPPVRLVLKPKACAAYFARMEHFMDTYDKYFTEHDMLQIEYERLLSDATHEQTRLTTFLGVAPYTLTAYTKRLNAAPLPSLIGNYASLERYFRGTKWHRFFTAN